MKVVSLSFPITVQLMTLAFILMAKHNLEEVNVSLHVLFLGALRAEGGHFKKKLKYIT